MKRIYFKNICLTLILIFLLSSCGVFNDLSNIKYKLVKEQNNVKIDKEDKNNNEDKIKEEAISYNIKGVNFFNHGDYKKAIEFYNKAISLNPDYELAYYNKGLIYWYSLDFEKTINFYVKVLKKHPNFKKIQFELGNKYALIYEYDKAGAIFNKLINKFPNFIDAYKNLGLVLFKKGNYKESLKIYNRALKINKNDPEIYYFKGKTLLELGKYDLAKKNYENAIKLYSKLVKLNPNIIDGCHGEQCFEFQEYDEEAKARLQLILSYEKIGDIYYAEQNYIEAIKSYEKLLKMYTNDLLYVKIGASYYNLKQYKKAIENYNIALDFYKNDFSPTTASIYYNRGISFYKLKDYKNYKKDIKKAYEMDPDNSLYKRDFIESQ